MANITSQAKVEHYLKRSLSASEQSLLTDSLLGAVTRWISRYMGVDYSTNSATTAYYDGTGGKWLFISPATTVSSVQYIDENGDVDDTLTADEDYVLYPLSGAPYDRILRRSTYWGKGYRNIKLTGTFNAATPDTIVLAATILVAKFISNDGNVRSRSIEGFSETFTEIADDTAEVYELLNSERGVLL